MRKLKKYVHGLRIGGLLVLWWWLPVQYRHIHKTFLYTILITD